MREEAHRERERALLSDAADRRCGMKWLFEIRSNLQANHKDLSETGNLCLRRESVCRAAAAAAALESLLFPLPGVVVTAASKENESSSFHDVARPCGSMTAFSTLSVFPT